MSERLGCQRALFDLSDDIIYLNCAYMSPSLKIARQAGEAGIRIKSEPWRVEPRHFFSGPDRVRGFMARLIGAVADDIAIVPSASYGIATAANNLPVAKGQEILLLAEQFPANVYSWRVKAEESGARIVTVGKPGPNGPGWAERIIEAINADTAIVALPHCHWTDGSLVDLPRVAERVRAVGAALVLDLSQSLGAMPIDVRDVDPDFLVAPCYKWLLGPYSLGFLYVAPRHQQGRPLEQTWIGREDAEDFQGLVDYRDKWDRGARRFDMGERAQFHLLPMALAALAQIERWQVARIAATLGDRTRLVARHAQDLGLDVSPEADRAPHFVGVRFPKGLPDSLLADLKARNIHVSARGSALRITPHLYNSDEEIDTFFRVLKDML